MNYLIVLFTSIILLLTVNSHAGFQGYDGDTNLGVMNQLECGAGLSCSKSRVKMSVVADNFGVDQNQVDSTDDVTLTSAQCGSTILGAGVHTVNLPEASTVIGCRYTFIVSGTDALTLDPDDADQILLLTNAAGDSLVADAAGESVVLEAISASEWAPVGAEKGTWTDSD